ncbi:MAG TPA: hypothetical protein VKR31_04600 [Rhizomicrobium sp.]|nr:hypothetical protein [Rhizomicrobium sp.]
MSHVLRGWALATTILVSAPALGSGAGAYHILPTPAYEARTGRIPPRGFSGEMEYFGGTVFSSVEVVSVMWGPDVNATTVAEIPDFSAAIVNSNFIDQLAEYGTVGLRGITGHRGSNQTISRGTYYGQVQITPHNPSRELTDDDIHAELKYQIRHGHLPPQGPNLLYMIYFPSDITITLDGLVSCQDFGAYHFSTLTHERANNTFYSVEPDCNAGFGYITFAASHEFAEATTDNIPTPGTNPAFPQAWNTSDGYEIADLCEGAPTGTLTDATTSYEVTQVYLNSTAACSTGNYTSP